MCQPSFRCGDNTRSLRRYFSDELGSQGPLLDGLSGSGAFGVRSIRPKHRVQCDSATRTQDSDRAPGNRHTPSWPPRHQHHRAGRTDRADVAHNVLLPSISCPSEAPPRGVSIRCEYLLRLWGTSPIRRSSCASLYLLRPDRPESSRKAQIFSGLYPLLTIRPGFPRFFAACVG